MKFRHMMLAVIPAAAMTFVFACSTRTADANKKAAEAKSATKDNTEKVSESEAVGYVAVDAEVNKQNEILKKVVEQRNRLTEEITSRYKLGKEDKINFQTREIIRKK